MPIHSVLSRAAQHRQGPLAIILSRNMCVTPAAMQVPVLYASRSSGGLKSQPSLLNRQSALLNSPSGKGRLFFPSRPKDADAVPAAAAPTATLRTQLSTEQRPLLPKQPSTAAPDTVSMQRLAVSSTAEQAGVVELGSQQRSVKQRVWGGAKGDSLFRLTSSEVSPPPPLPPRHRTEVYLALVVQVAVVADGGVSAMWCRSLRVASSVLARAVFRKALELYECGTRPHHLQPLLRLQHLKRQSHVCESR